jgi:hypothetical protein
MSATGTVSWEADGERPAVGVAAMIGVLVGNRTAILRAAAARGTIALGAVLVLAAGLARNYDGEDLRHEPWWLIVPFVVSAVLGLSVYALARVNVSGRPPFWAGYRSLLGVMWLIAPTALLYGVPWERMLPPVQAVAANLWTLALVSVWRVALMARVVSVLAGLGFVTAFFRVMLVAGAVAFVGLLTVPKPLIHFMGGVRQTEAERMVAGVAHLATCASGLLMLLWLGGGIAALAAVGGWRGGTGGRGRVTAGAFVLASLCLAPWLVALPRTQTEQRLRYDAERLLKAGRIDDGLALMAAHGRHEFPPQWDPPPKVGWDVAESPPVLDVVERVVARGTSGWVREVYLDKFDRQYLGRWPIAEDVRPRVDALMSAMPEAPDFKARRLQRYGWVDEGTTSAATAPTTQQGAAR